MDQAVRPCVLAGRPPLEKGRAEGAVSGKDLGSFGEEVDSVVSIVFWAFLRNRLGRNCCCSLARLRLLLQAQFSQPSRIGVSGLGDRIAFGQDAIAHHRLRLGPEKRVIGIDTLLRLFIHSGAFEILQ